MERARFEGARLLMGAHGAVVLDSPGDFPEELLHELKLGREAVAAALREEAEFEAALRSWLPAYGSPAVDRSTGRTGLLWGATARGLIVDFGAGAPLLTMDPRDVRRALEPAG